MASTTPVRDVMTAQVITLAPEQTFEEAADLLAERSIGAAPVVDADGVVVGLLRDEDLIISEANLHAPTWFSFLGAEFPFPGQAKRFESELKRMTAATVADLMATEFPTCGPDDTLGSVAAAMHDNDVTHMPVVDGDGHLVGIVARGDLVRRVAARHVTDLPDLRPVWGEVDLGAVRENTRALATFAEPARLLAVVKADGYGHGAVPVARAALEAGASWLGVALVEEGAALRAAGIDAPILVLSEPAPAAADAVVAHRLTPVVYTPGGIDALAKAVVAGGGDRALAVHLKVDTGMHRVGCAVADAVALVEAIAASRELELEGICTHLAVADEPDHPYTQEQIDRFDALLADLEARGSRPPIVHAANSAGLLAHPGARYDLVRVGIAIYGVPPSAALAERVALRPVLSLHAQVSHVKDLPRGSRLSYGLRYELPSDARVVTVPVGYADGVPRNLGLAGGEVLVGGVRCPIAGTVTMDQLMVDVGERDVAVGDDVVLLGRQGDAEITAVEWADRLGTIPYEIVTGIGPRVPRRLA